jgi:hypothetical protein
MKIGNLLYFAPSISFRDIDVDGPEIVRQFKARIEGYYLAPADSLIERNDAFSAVLLLASSLDALGRYDLPNLRTNRIRYITWLQKWMPSFSEELNATIFYENIRCGLVHEARAKFGCEFNFGIITPVDVEGNIMAINPILLAVEVRSALETFCRERENASALAAFQTALKKDFHIELAHVGRT